MLFRSIVDDQRLLCEGFRELIELQPNLEVVGIAGDGEEALATIERLQTEQMASLSSTFGEPSMIAPVSPAFVGGNDVERLTEREREILALLMRGLPIARSARPSISLVVLSRTTSATSWVSWGCATAHRQP